jgi:KaiC/GvpD/RAD55 family RecA-like ATPase
MPTASHEVTTDLSDDDIAARIAMIEAGPAPVAAHIPTHGNRPVNDYKHFAPLGDAADEYIRFAQTPGQRVYLGIDTFDQAMRGIAPGELLLVVGYAHSGKTVLTTEVILNNRNRRIAFFTPDETRVLVLVKLASLVHGVSAEDLEQRIANDDPEAIEMVRSVAATEFPNLAVFDQGLDIREMDRAIAEVTDHWGNPPELLIFDYLDLLQGAGEDVPSKVNNIKAWGKRHGCPLMLLHQSSRTAGADGRAVTISSGGFGGEQQATFMVGVRRKKSELIARIKELEEKIAASSKDPSLLEVKLDEARYDLSVHQNTVTFSLVKNKRPPSRLVDDMDFTLDQNTGRIQTFNQRATHRNNMRDQVAANRGWTDQPFDEDF